MHRPQFNFLQERQVTNTLWCELPTPCSEFTRDEQTAHHLSMQALIYNITSSYTYICANIHTYMQFGLLTFTHCSSYLSVIKLSFLHIVCCLSDSDSKVLLSLDSSSMMPYILIYDTQTSLSRYFKSNPVIKIKVLPSSKPNFFSQFFSSDNFQSHFFIFFIFS